MAKSTIERTRALGQSIWLDFISRGIIESGELKQLIDEVGLGGVTSNPAILEQAVREGREYAPALAALRRAHPGADAFELYEQLAVRDIQDACDVLERTWKRTRGQDGFVSLEVTLHRGEAPAGILAEARHLWRRVARPNLMIKVPGTPAGIAALPELIAEGINVNVTLLFARDVYQSAARAYVAGLERRAQAGGDLRRVASVASFFVSRIDTAVDAQLERQLAAAGSERGRAAIAGLLGRAAIANAKLAYRAHARIFAGKRWEALVALGAQEQRLLWASTGTKNKAYSDVLYVDELIGKGTVNTAPPQTIAAFRDHGRPRASLTEGVDEAQRLLERLARRGVVLSEVTDQLLADGLRQFSEAFERLLATIEASAPGARRPEGAAGGRDAAAQAGTPAQAAARAGAPATGAARADGGFASLTFAGPREIADGLRAAEQEWEAGGRVARLWRRDAELWSGGDEARWLDWLDAPAAAQAAIPELERFSEELRAAGFTHALLLGMGGSSLCPEVQYKVHGTRAGFLELRVLDSTDPAQVLAAAQASPLERTLVIVASKSGSTLEPNIMEACLWSRVVEAVGERAAGRHFVAITDPGSKLEQLAARKGYRRVFSGVPGIGGRFSALSIFGLLPAALIGVDLRRHVARAAAMLQACGPQVAPRANPGFQLGALLGVAARCGRDKLTLVMPPPLASLGAWLEQLVAESTGKQGRGIIPVDLEPLAAPAAYGEDRLFVQLRLTDAPDAAQDGAVAALERAGQAVARIEVPGVHDLGAEFCRWMLATAVAGALLGINPFDQPDVEASKIATRELTEAYERSGKLPVERPFFEEGPVRLFADKQQAQRLFAATGKGAELTDVLAAHLATLQAGDYFALLAWVGMEAHALAELTAMRAAVRDATRAATCVGFGPRFLHSTGQAYKGGPNTGVFLQITADDALDLEVPGARYSFGTVKAAQARGDFHVLVERGRRALRAHLSGGVHAGLAALRRALVAALSRQAQVRS